MPTFLRLLPGGVRLVLALVLASVLAVGCAQSPAPPGGSAVAETHRSPDPPPGTLAAGTCWSGHLLGADPQDVLALSKKYDVPYLVAAHALADRPAFDSGVRCGNGHAVEVYKLVRLPALASRLTDYAVLLQVRSPLYATVGRSVARACMTDRLARAAAATGLPGAVMEPVLPDDATLGWAPAAPDDWSRGRREFACTLTWQDPSTVRYSTVFTRALPTGDRTCILSRTLEFVDCARRHDRERIAVIDARDAVAAGRFPGPGAVRGGPRGRFLDVPDARWAKLDAACTAYLRSISTTKKLTGVANVDADQWPTPTGAFPIYCDADTPPDRESLITQGSVYDR